GNIMLKLTERVLRREPRGSDGAPAAGDATGGQPEQDPAAGGATARSAADDSGLSVQARRAGMFLVTDSEGREVARIRGDYVVGFSTDHQGRLRRFEDLESARLAIQADLVDQGQLQADA
ncbi:MAG TPA: hypothetical protein VFX53_12135, partial [Pedococcus sp.]|nr:hypothetical protein [Pedococcus sp.]